MIRPEIYGLSGSSEFQAALWFQRLFEAGTHPSEKGTIRLHVKPNMGQQLDVLLHGYFSEAFSRRLVLPDSPEPEQITFLDVIATIEVKMHGRSGVNLSSTNATVFYGNKPSDASDQSKRQARNTKNFISRGCKFTPWVCNLIFFPNLTKDDLPQSRLTNYLAGNSTLEDLLEVLCINNPRYMQEGNENFSCVGGTAGDIQARYQQLYAMLGNFQHRMQPQSRRRGIFASQTASRSAMQPASMHGQLPATAAQIQRRMLGRYLLYLLAIVLAVFLIWQVVLVSSRAMRTFHAKLVQSQHLAQTAVTTCMSETPSCGWHNESTYHHGMTIYFHFEGLDENVLSVRIQNPHGDTAILPFHKASKAPGEKATYLAKMPLDRRALIGAYSVTADAKDIMNQTERSFTEHFMVEP